MSNRRLERVSAPISARIRPPGSKSITIRALVAAGLAHGRSHLYGALRADDSSVTVEALRAFGVQISDEAEPWTVVGSGGHLAAPGHAINAGQSGLGARISLVLAAHADGTTRIEGEGRLLRRPIDGLVRSLSRQGAAITTNEGFLPASVDGVGGLWGGNIDVDSSLTSQFATALMLVAPLMAEGANLNLEGIESSHGYAALTARVMETFGANVSPTITGYEVSAGGYEPTDFVIEPDASAAAYPMLAAAICGGEVVIEGLSLDSYQPDIAVARSLGAMGCEVGDSNGDIRLRGTGEPLAPVDVDMSDAPDGALAIAVAAMFSSGPSRLSGLGSLRHKESDRLAALAQEMRRLGCGVRVERDSLHIEPGDVHGGAIDSHGDHRIAMALGVIGLRVADVSVRNAGVVSKTWPGYWEEMARLSS